MKYNLNALLIVEGQNDKSYLSNFLNSHIFVTDGFDAKRQIDYLKEVIQVRQIILLLDPDPDGRKIAQFLLDNLGECLNIYIDYPLTSKKHGVFECDKDTIIKYLQPYFVDEPEAPTLSMSTLLRYIDKKDKIIAKYHIIGKTNKNLLEKLNVLKITENDLKLI
ncbi:MAG: hypothetical protein LUD22_00245 [Coprobacillus sp.]|nr:hypothetical protein [Coprobacillus sp.]